MLQRDSKGRFMSTPMSEEDRQKISEGQVRRHLRQRQQIVAEPDRKKCSRPDCPSQGRWLKVPDDFPMRKRKLKCGEVRRYPAGECKLCNRRRADEWKAKIIREQGIEAWRAMNKRWNDKRDKEHKRKYNREYQRIQAALEGRRQRGPWKKYAHELDERLKLVPAEPFVQWFQSLNGSTPTESQMGPRLARAVRRATSGEIQKIHLDIVDEVGVLVGQTYLIHTLYAGM
jgi:hypothetical protein